MIPFVQVHRIKGFIEPQDCFGTIRDDERVDDLPPFDSVFSNAFVRFDVSDLPFMGNSDVDRKQSAVSLHSYADFVCRHKLFILNVLQV